MASMHSRSIIGMLSMDLDLSSVSEDFEAVLTPPGKTNGAIKKTGSPLMLDEDSGLGMETDEIEELNLSPLFMSFGDDGNLDGSYSEIMPSRTSSHVARKSLFAGKRQAEPMCLEDESTPNHKRVRHISSKSSLLKFALTNSPKHSEEHGSAERIISAVDQLVTDTGLVADGSRDYSLPSIPGKHGDLKTISIHTMAELLQNREFSDRLLIVDCRYPFEFEGGHIQGAVNLYTKDQIYELLNTPDKPRVIVFHCEFSSERGPKMYRFLRSSDRELNKDHYPKLHYPELYLLGGGYKEFYHTYQNLCDPIGYKPMLHKDHTSDLRHFRVKSKSWAGTNQRKHAPKSRLMSRSCLSLKY